MQRRLSFGTDVVRTPGKINMSRPSSTSDNSRLSSGSRQRDCQLGQLQTAYFGLCKKVQAPVLWTTCFYSQYMAASFKAAPVQVMVPIHKSTEETF